MDRCQGKQRTAITEVESGCARLDTSVFGGEVHAKTEAAHLDARGDFESVFESVGHGGGGVDAIVHDFIPFKIDQG